MHYRTWKSGEKISALGFGAMRMPTHPAGHPQEGRVDQDSAVQLIRRGIDQGINYVDTAWPYHEGDSEKVCGLALRNGYREKVKLATKMPSWELKRFEDMEFFLDEQLKRLETDSIDYYLLHTLNPTYWDLYRKIDYKRFFTEAKAQGKIKHSGFSFHADLDLFKEILDDFDWDFCQIQLNLLDENYQAGLEGLRYAAEKGIDVVIMEPLRGGMLAPENPSGELARILEEAPVQRKMPEWALRWLWDLPEVSLVLSGMSNTEQLDENIRSASAAEAGSLTRKEKETLTQITDYYLSRIRVKCTQCRYCMPCPAGVNIPEIFWAYNHDGLFDDRGKAEFWINGYLGKEQAPSKCVNCGLCLSKCPQGIAIPEELAKVGALLEK